MLQRKIEYIRAHPSNQSEASSGRMCYQSSPLLCRTKEPLSVAPTNPAGLKHLFVFVYFHFNFDRKPKRVRFVRGWVKSKSCLWFRIREINVNKSLDQVCHDFRRRPGELLINAVRRDKDKNNNPKGHKEFTKWHPWGVRSEFGSIESSVGD